MELYEKSATELLGMLKNKQCSSVEITKSVFKRISQVEDKVNSYITLCEEEALEQAQNVDSKIANGGNVNILEGIPIGIKDNICTKDILTTCGSKMLYNFIPPYDATVMQKLSNLGSVTVGKLNMDEFAMGASTENSYYKKTKNPHNLEFVPGGSSGGTTAAVAAGQCIVALGSDTGGSVRQPSAFCGVVGLKPTYGSVSRYGLIAFASSLDQIGPVGRTVSDVAMLYTAICGNDDHDATTESLTSSDFFNNIKGDINGLRVGLPKEYFGDGIDDDVKQAVKKAASLLEQNGAIVEEISLPSTDYALSVYYIISSAEASSNLARFDGVKYGYRAKDYKDLTDMYEKTRSEGFGNEVKRRIMLGTFVLSSGYYDSYYKKAKLLQRQIMTEFDDCFKKYDVILTPTTPSTAFKIGKKTNKPLKMYTCDICTVTSNIAGLPAISVPCGKGANGMPIGMQLIANKFKEQTLFNTAKFYEDLIGGFGKIPIIN